MAHRRRYQISLFVLLALIAVIACPVLYAADEPVRVSGEKQVKKLVHKVTPEYPPDAKEARIQGTVRLEVVIDKEGAAKEVRVLEGHPKLAAAAVNAVRQWVWEPTYVNGKAVEVIANIDVNFTLKE